MAKKVVKKKKQESSESESESEASLEESHHSDFKPQKGIGIRKAITKGATKEPPKQETPAKQSQSTKKSKSKADLKIDEDVEIEFEPRVEKPGRKAKAQPQKTKKVNTKKQGGEDSQQGSEVEEEKEKDTFKPYQKKETPPSDDPCRRFYETLHRQRPDSVIALKYCLDYGLLDGDQIKKAVKALEKKAKK